MLAYCRERLPLQVYLPLAGALALAARPTGRDALSFALDTTLAWLLLATTRLWDDLQTALDHGLTLLNLATEPVTTEAVARECFGVEFTNELAAPPGSYDMRTVHAEVFGRTGPYLYSAHEVLGALRDFVAAERSVA